MDHPLLRVHPPVAPETAMLYARPAGGPPPAHEGGLLLKQGQRLSLDTYFGAFYESLYARYTQVDTVAYLLDLEGRFRITLNRTLADGHVQRLLEEEREGTPATPVRLPLPSLRGPDKGRGRLGVELECLAPEGVWRGASVVSASPPPRKVRLGIILCTYRKEAYLKRTLDTLLTDQRLAQESFSILVVDNGGTLDPADLSDPRVRLIPNRNLGGSGGFGRGLIEALHEPGLTHFLFMDDDIALDSEAVARLFPLFAYARGDLAVAGGMLDLLAPTRLFEAGARYSPLVSYPLKQGLDLAEPSSLDALLREERIDYGGFWFFAFSRGLVQRIGGVMPFFIKVDDMEFGLRIGATAETPIVAFPGIGVWHEPFYAKIPIWDIYYYTRNNLVANAIHAKASRMEILTGLSRRVVGRLLLFDYNAVEMLLRGLEDYLKGPDGLRRLDPETWHAGIIAASRAHESSRQPVEREASAHPPEDIPSSSIPLFTRLAALLTLNGHLLPRILLKGGAVYVSDSPRNWPRIFGHSEVRFHNPHSGAFRSRLDRRLGLQMLRRWIGLSRRAFSTWRATTDAWREAAPELRSESFLREYYGFRPLKEDRHA